MTPARVRQRLKKLQEKVESLTPPKDLARLSSVDFIRRLFSLLEKIPGIAQMERVFEALSEPQKEENAELLNSIFSPLIKSVVLKTEPPLSPQDWQAKLEGIFADWRRRHPTAQSPFVPPTPVPEGSQGSEGSIFQPMEKSASPSVQQEATIPIPSAPGETSSPNSPTDTVVPARVVQEPARPLYHFPPQGRPSKHVFWGVHECHWRKLG